VSCLPVAFFAIDPLLVDFRLERLTPAGSAVSLRGVRMQLHYCIDTIIH
jgi:hypothetical protein